MSESKPKIRPPTTTKPNDWISRTASATEAATFCILAVSISELLEKLSTPMNTMSKPARRIFRIRSGSLYRLMVSQVYRLGRWPVLACQLDDAVDGLLSPARLAR